MPQDVPTAKKLVWSKSSPHSRENLKKPIGGLSNRNKNALRWVHESFYYLQQTRNVIKFLFTSYLIVESLWVQESFYYLQQTRSVIKFLFTSYLTVESE